MAMAMAMTMTMNGWSCISAEADSNCSWCCCCSNSNSNSSSRRRNYGALSSSLQNTRPPPPAPQYKQQQQHHLHHPLRTERPRCKATGGGGEGDAGEGGILLYSADESTKRRRRRRELLLRIVGATTIGATSVVLKTLSNEAEAEAEAETEAEADSTITDRVYLEITKCASSALSRTGGGSSPPPSSSPAVNAACEVDVDGALGRIVIGLYGKQVPETVANFKAMCIGKAYRGCVIHRIVPGQYIATGRQGSKEVVLPDTRNVGRNPETVSPNAFKLGHSRPGTVSLCLSENDDDDEFKLSTDYRNVEFLITTGPGPAPQLDSKNIVFGTVLQGLDVVTAVAAVPTYKPSERIRQFNDLALLLGDERASNARNLWYRPQKAIYISDCGEA